MGLMDAFNADDRIQIKVGDLYDFMKVSANNAATARYLMNAVNCEVPYRYIRETVTGEKEESGDGNFQAASPRDILTAALKEAEKAAREATKEAGVDLEKVGVNVDVNIDDPPADCAPADVSCADCAYKEGCEALEENDGNAAMCADLADREADAIDEAGAAAGADEAAESEGAGE